MKASECKNCGVREHNHVCAASRMARAIEASAEAQRDLVAARKPVVLAIAERDAAPVTERYAPDGDCEWCDRRRAAEAARIRVWRAKKRGGP